MSTAAHWNDPRLTGVMFCSACRQLVVTQIRPERCPYCCQMTLQFVQRRDDGEHRPTPR